MGPIFIYLFFLNLGVPLHLFFLSVLVGLMPYNYLCVTSGVILADISDVSDILSWTNLGMLIRRLRYPLIQNSRFRELNITIIRNFCSKLFVVKKVSLCKKGLRIIMKNIFIEYRYLQYRLPFVVSTVCSVTLPYGT